MYESGVYLATLLGIIKVSFKGAKALSIEAKNYKKVDLYLDLPSGKFISKEPVLLLLSLDFAGLLFFFLYCHGLR